MSRNSRNPISWVPTVYFAMGLPFVVLNMVSVLMFKGLGIDDAQIALWTSLIMLPWTLKFLWSPFLEMFKTKKFFVVLTQQDRKSTRLNSSHGRLCPGSVGVASSGFLCCMYCFTGDYCFQRGNA